MISRKAVTLYLAGLLGRVSRCIKTQLRVLWAAEALPPFAFAVHPRVPKVIVANIQKAMQEMERHPTGLALLKAVNLHGIQAADEADYDSMHKLDIKPVDTK